MPVLNRVSTIEKSIQALLAQNYSNLEFIVIDGGSTDGTVDIIKKYQAHISYWHSKPDGSPSIAINLGVEKATGDLIVLYMADDWYESGVLNAVGEALVANPDADIITCGGRIVEYDSKTKHYQTHKVYVTEDELALSFYNVCFAISAICCRFIRKSLFDRIGLYPTQNGEGKHMLCNDKEFLLRAIVHGVKDIFVPMIGHNYLASNESSTFGNHHENILSMCQDHIWIAKTYLARTDLSWKQRLMLHYWYTDQITRLTMYGILDKNPKAIITNTIHGFKKYHFLWPLAFCTNAAKITYKKMTQH